MKRPRVLLILSVVCLSLASVLPMLAQTRATTTVLGPRAVTFPSGEETVRGVLYQPQGAGPFPALVIIHEWWGLNDWVKQQAQMFAKHGYATLAVDLYRGQMANDPEMAHELMRALPQDRGVQYLQSAVTYLRTQKDVKPNRIGAVGWCMGGGFALQLAIAEPSLRAVAINYGALDTDPAQLKKIHAAVLGNFGAMDRGITPRDVQSFAAEMQKLGHPVDVKDYPDAGHAFENPNNKAGYRAADTADADRRMFTFFARTLKH
ncbi:MAG: dienelactone hydrolase family protein [Acidobacteriaceae bacterium]